MTAEFFRLVRTRMAEGGLLMMNLLDVSRRRELLLSTVATLKGIFPSVFVFPRPYGNHILLAFPRPWLARSIHERLGGLEAMGPVGRLAQEAARDITELIPPAGTLVFTDDRAPVEEITRRMLAEYRDRRF